MSSYLHAMLINLIQKQQNLFYNLKRIKLVIYTVLLSSYIIIHRLTLKRDILRKSRSHYIRRQTDRSCLSVSKITWCLFSPLLAHICSLMYKPFREKPLMSGLIQDLYLENKVQSWWLCSGWDREAWLSEIAQNCTYVLRNAGLQQDFTGATAGAAACRGPAARR